MKNRLIYIFYPSFEIGGIGKILVKLINFLIKKNYNIKLYSQNTSKKKFIFSNKLKIVNLKKYKKNKSFFRRIFLIFLIAQKMFFDIRKENQRVVIVSMQDHIMSIIVGIFSRKKILIRNSEEILGATKFADNKIVSKIVLFIKRIFYQFADTIIVNASKSKDSMKSIIYNDKKVKLIYNPYIKKILPHTKKKIKKEFLIVSAGRFTKQKNFGMLIKIIKKLRNDGLLVKLNIIGSGPQFKKLNYISRNVDYIKFNKWTNDLKKYFNKANLFILPSLYEGSPNVLLDAVNHNIPILSSDCSGAKDILKNNTKFVFEINNSCQLKKKIKNIILNYKNAVEKTKINKINLKKYTSKNLNMYLKEINYLYEKKN